MNEEDSEQISLYLDQCGHQPADSLREAQFILLNTCSVRRKPEDKAFSLLGQIAEFKRANPEIVVGVCGCMAQVRAEEIRRRAPHVDFVVGTAQIAEIPALIHEALDIRRFRSRIDLPERKGAVVTDIPRRKVSERTKLKAFVPIQYGCDKFCTFCIVPSTRGRERSRPTSEVLVEVEELVQTGTKEVTLLGQTVNSYGKNLLEGNIPFSQLLWKLNEIEGLERIRYTSPYPRDFKSDLIQTIRDCPKVMEHVHMPIQSGDDAMLKSMRRLYSIESYMEIIDELRSTVPGVAITTDVIVGFPGETDEQFENTVEIMKRVRYDGAYMFAFSPRPGTPAGDMPQLPLSVKKERLARLIEVQNEITLEINEASVGDVVEVLVEGTSARNKDRLQGYARNFRMIHFSGPVELVGRTVAVKLVDGNHWGNNGRLLAV